MNMHSPIMLPDRQEAFCQHVAALKTYTEAYKLAYGASQRQAEANGSRMMRRDKVKDRIAQIRADNEAAQRVSLPFLTLGLLSAARLADQTNQPSAKVAAYMGIAKLHGFLIDRAQIDLLVRRPSASPESPDEMSEEQWLAQHSIPSIDILPNAEPQVEKDSIVDSIVQGSTSTEHNSDE